MAREIKFRGWHIPTKKMIDLKKITPLALDAGLQHQDGLFLPFSGDVVLEQYANRKDKNGVEIYEGDIVKLHNNIEITKEEYWFPVYEVQYVNLGFDLKYVGGGMNPQSQMFHFAHYFKSFEVIGNIHDNPELLP
ncbi:YopX family protein [Dyadobacter sp. CY261]|uniref:YopX family protein n=1 Tax=Dyadobacter sp. CY261 TaxID=2907203 RepID=UPI001F1C21E0|nr:YopX family protein [Dyadobacter sp. CY261]MCF0070264.1 YopX family protein [Dyadobacter sp. CY261]